jgi:hypothetical protein
MATTIIIPENASLAEYKTLLDDARAQGADINIIFAILDKIKAKEDRLALIAETEGFKPTRAKLFVRRTADEVIEELVPDVDVFDDIAVQDLKRKHTGNKRIFTDEDELKAFQELKVEGVSGIDYEMVKERVAANKTVVDANVNAEATEATEATELEDTDNDEG